MRILISLLIALILFSGCSATNLKGGKKSKASKKIEKLLAGYKSEKRSKHDIIKEYWELQKVVPLPDGGIKQVYIDHLSRKKQVYLNKDRLVVWVVIHQNKEILSDIGWYTNGNKQHEMLYDNGKLVSYQVWHSNGQLKQSWDIQDGWRVSSKAYQADGTMNYEARYQNGQPIWEDTKSLIGPAGQ